MKKIILVVLISVMLATPCFAQEVEPEGMFSLEGTLWVKLEKNEMDSYTGFNGGEIYSIGTFSSEQFPVPTEQCSPVSEFPGNDVCFYSTLPLFAMFYYDYVTMSKTHVYGFMLPQLSIGFKFYPSQFGDRLFRYVDVLIKVDSNWVPPEMCFLE